MGWPTDASCGFAPFRCCVINPPLLAGLTLAVAALSFAAGIRWEEGASAIALKAVREEARKAAEKADKGGIEHAETVDRLNRQLNTTRGQLHALTTGRICLDAPAVRLLNAIGGVPAAASQPTGEAHAFASDRDVGNALADCRAEHAKLSSQLNKILDIEDERAAIGQ